MNCTDHEVECFVPQVILLAQHLPATLHYSEHLFSLETDVTLLKETHRRKIHRLPPASQLRSFGALREDLISQDKLRLTEYSALHGRFLEHHQYPTCLQLQNRYAHLMLTYTGVQTWSPRSYNVAVLFLTRERYMAIIKSQIINSNALLAAYIPTSEDEAEQSLSTPTSAPVASLTPIIPVTPTTPVSPSNTDTQPPIRRKKRCTIDKPYRVKISTRDQSTGPRKVLPGRVAKKELSYAEDRLSDESTLDIQSPDQTPITSTPRYSARLDVDRDDTIPTSYKPTTPRPQRRSLAIHIADEQQCSPSSIPPSLQPTQLFQTPADSACAPTSRPNTTRATSDESTTKSRLDTYEKQLGDVQTMVLSMHSMLHTASEKVQNVESSFDNLKESICKIESLLQGPLQRNQKTHSNSRKRKFVPEERSHSDTPQEKQQRTAIERESERIENGPTSKKPNSGSDTDSSFAKIDLNVVAGSGSKDQQPKNPSSQRKHPSDQGREDGSVMSWLLGLFDFPFVRREASV
ncbi:hypothetical protein BWQ96_00413 [Gracilariopsis chorda]|uniref:Uncharacterized protein n=1 Tax=Gracilariopsis chorda TaxID=448386 RepID=A0A2V3J5R4_9FLOR|nr:hypothetical protein BWQ96_00413 [Gracilariopsis chorda]|eukprot:PXF49761.1 hypothetical protein BWQ96_00413 [Gracilariopsis chorda]